MHILAVLAAVHCPIMLRAAHMFSELFPAEHIPSNMNLMVVPRGDAVGVLHENAKDSAHYHSDYVVLTVGGGKIREIIRENIDSEPIGLEPDASLKGECFWNGSGGDDAITSQLLCKQKRTETECVGGRCQWIALLAVDEESADELIGDGPETEAVGDEAVGSEADSVQSAESDSDSVDEATDGIDSEEEQIEGVGDGENVGAVEGDGDRQNEGAEAVLVAMVDGEQSAEEETKWTPELPFQQKQDEGTEPAAEGDIGSVADSEPTVVSADCVWDGSGSGDAAELNELCSRMSESECSESISRCLWIGQRVRGEQRLLAVGGQSMESALNFKVPVVALVLAVAVVFALGRLRRWWSNRAYKSFIEDGGHLLADSV